MLTEHRIGIIITIIAATGYAFLPILARIIYDLSELNPTDIALWRFIFAVPIIWLVVLTRERLQPQKRPKKPLPILRILPLGFLYAGLALATFTGLRYISASLFVVLFFTHPAMIAVLSRLMGSRLPAVGWVAVALTLVGVFLTVPDLSSLEVKSSIGIAIALFNAFLVAIYFITISRVMKGVSSMGRASAWVITGALLPLILMIPVYRLQVPPNTMTWLALIAIAAVSTAMPIALMNAAVQMIGATQTAVIGAIQPVLSMVLALFLLGELILPMQWVGAIVIVLAVILLETQRRKPETKVVKNAL